MEAQDQLLTQLDALDRRLARLWDQTGEGADDSIPRDQALEELGTAVEELHVAAEEMARAGEALADERHRYQDLFEFAPDAYAVTDSDAVLREVNVGFTELVGIDGARLVGKPLAAYLVESGHPTLHDRLRTMPQSRGVEMWQATLRRRDGTVRIVSLRCGTVRDRNGEVNGLRWLIRDVSAEVNAREAERKAQEALAIQLQHHADQLRAVEKVKSDFLRLASHELHGPITVLRGYLSMIADGELGALPDATSAVLPVLIDRCDAMKRLVDQMIETARLEDSSLQLATATLDIRDIVRKATDSAMAFVRLSGHNLVVDSPPPPVMVRVDPGRIVTIITNLVDNAAKYSPRGTTVSVSTESTDQVRVHVADHGTGIDDAGMEQLFSRFGRIVTPATSHIAGTGLGLYLAREIARLHGGDVVLTRSEQGVGSVFTLVLPRAPGESEA